MLFFEHAWSIQWVVYSNLSFIWVIPLFSCFIHFDLFSLFYFWSFYSSTPVRTHLLSYFICFLSYLLHYSLHLSHSAPFSILSLIFPLFIWLASWVHLNLLLYSPSICTSDLCRISYCSSSLILMILDLYLVDYYNKSYSKLSSINHFFYVHVLSCFNHFLISIQDSNRNLSSYFYENPKFSCYWIAAYSCWFFIV